MWRSLKQKLPLVIVGATLAALFLGGILNWDKTVGWVRHYFFRAKGTVQSIGSSPPAGNTAVARSCRENLSRIQAAKRKAAFDRGQNVGPITWDDVIKQLAEVPRRRLSPAELQKYMPRCPGGGTYSIGTLEQVPRCSIAGQNTMTLEDDHVIRD